MTSKPDIDERLVEAHDLALNALREITPASSIGPAAGYLVEDDGSVSLRFENRLPGYPGWYWTVTVARVGDEEPTVLEVELLPGDGALLAPEWVPWAERLAEYRAHQTALAEQAAAVSEDLEEIEAVEIDELEIDELDDLEIDDFDELDVDEFDDAAFDDTAFDEFDDSPAGDSDVPVFDEDE
ncbi:MAG: DUF3027 domain-containing protein [Microbacterium sp.]